MICNTGGDCSIGAAGAAGAAGATCSGTASVVNNASAATAGATCATFIASRTRMSNTPNLFCPNFFLPVPQ